MRAKFSLTDTVFIVQVSVMNLRVIFARLYGLHPEQIFFAVGIKCW